MTTKPHDALFKAGLEAPEHAASVFRSLLPADVVARIDWNSLTRVPGAFIDPLLADRHTDLLFSAQLRDQIVLLYLHLEHQSTEIADMLLRMLIYMVRIWEHHRKENRAGPLPIILPVMICHTPGGWTAPTAFHDLFEPHPGSIPSLERLVPQFSLLLADLTKFDNDALKQSAIEAFPKLVLWALRDARDMPTLLANLGHWAETFDDLLQSSGGLDAVGQLFRYVSLVGGEVYYDEFRQTLREQLPEAEKAMRSIADLLHERGREEGLEEGHKEGRKEGHKEGRRELFLTLLSAKFGELRPAEVERIRDASDHLLERYIQRFVAAETLETMFRA